MGQLRWKRAWRILQKLSMQPPHDPAIALLGIYPREMNTSVHTKKKKKKSFVNVYSKFIFNKPTWKQPTCPSIGKC